MSPLAAALWTVALTMTALMAVSITESVRAGALTDIVNRAACEVLATSLVVFAMVRWHSPHGSIRATIGLRSIGWAHAPLSVAVGVGLAPALSFVQDWVLRRWPMPDDADAEALQKLIASSSRVGIVVSAFVVVPIARELFFRGILFEGVRRSAGARSAILATSVFFACSTLEPQQVPVALLLALSLGWLRESASTVVAPILAQLAYGAVEGVPLLRGRPLDADVTYPMTWVAGGAGLALAALALSAAMGRERLE
jgi:membrane protease YdiL (CAAX protease family)